MASFAALHAGRYWHLARHRRRTERCPVLGAKLTSCRGRRHRFPIRRQAAQANLEVPGLQRASQQRPRYQGADHDYRPVHRLRRDRTSPPHFAYVMLMAGAGSVER